MRRARRNELANWLGVVTGLVACVLSGIAIWLVVR